MEQRKSPQLNFLKVGPIRLFEQVAEQIRALIVEGHLQPGDKLPSELELSEALGVSRASIREALRALESKGLIEVRSGAGAFVASRPFSLFSASSEAVEWLIKQRESLLQLLEVRESVEGLTASLAAASVSSELLEKLGQVVREQEKLSGTLSALDRQVELDIRFHELIAEASGNTIAEEIVDAIVARFCDSNRAILYLNKGNLEKTITEHRRVIEALASGDRVKAEAAMRAHIARVRADIEKVEQESEQ
ncbi:MAG: FadR family transcriptional regulator [Chloroflexi bacterium]|nr:FadR family transcriptional regulator [Chloroflexota bacterium]